MSVFDLPRMRRVIRKTIRRSVAAISVLCSIAAGFTTLPLFTIERCKGEGLVGVLFECEVVSLLIALATVARLRRIAPMPALIGLLCLRLAPFPVRFAAMLVCGCLGIHWH
jgi:hypothetical protein